MADSNRNRNSNKSTDHESRRGTLSENRGNKKLPDNKGDKDERLSTSGDTSNPKYSKTGVRKEEKERRDSSDKEG